MKDDILVYQIKLKKIENRYWCILGILRWKWAKNNIFRIFAKFNFVYIGFEILDKVSMYVEKYHSMSQLLW